MDEQKKILKQLKMGTTEILILTVLTRGAGYGYEISREVFKKSKGFFEFQQGFLYPTLQRMEREKLISGYWKGSTGGGPRRKYYRLTRKGRSRLDSSVRAWSRFSREFRRMLSMAKA